MAKRKVSDAQRRVLMAVYDGKKSHHYIFREPVLSKANYGRVYGILHDHGLLEYYGTDPNIKERVSGKGHAALIMGFYEAAP